MRLVQRGSNTNHIFIKLQQILPSSTNHPSLSFLVPWAMVHDDCFEGPAHARGCHRHLVPVMLVKSEMSPAVGQRWLLVVQNGSWSLWLITVNRWLVVVQSGSFWFLLVGSWYLLICVEMDYWLVLVTIGKYWLR